MALSPDQRANTLTGRIARSIATDQVIRSERAQRGIRAKEFGNTRRNAAIEYLRYEQNPYMKSSELARSLAEIMDQDGTDLAPLRAVGLNILSFILQLVEE